MADIKKIFNFTRVIKKMPYKAAMKYHLTYLDNRDSVQLTTK